MTKQNKLYNVIEMEPNSLYVRVKNVGFSNLKLLEMRLRNCEKIDLKIMPYDNMLDETTTPRVDMHLHGTGSFFVEYVPSKEKVTFSPFSPLTQLHISDIQIDLNQVQVKEKADK